VHFTNVATLTKINGAIFVQSCVHLQEQCYRLKRCLHLTSQIYKRKLLHGLSDKSLVIGSASQCFDTKLDFRSSVHANKASHTLWTENKHAKMLLVVSFTKCNRMWLNLMHVVLNACATSIAVLTHLTWTMSLRYLVKLDVRVLHVNTKKCHECIPSKSKIFTH